MNPPAITSHHYRTVNIGTSDSRSRSREGIQRCSTRMAVLVAGTDAYNGNCRVRLCKQLRELGVIAPVM
jgi:hypothetical protein